ncbi:periplasmic trehalase [Paraburkholderia piptadeniae]|uniref:Putative periplasmic trehalase n=1 Tax=Paraburkholderia piptadeniae TaxID=1701573 RepID=A0A1N7RQE9_9BURK|nr:alpha,alpha-trehalase TreF [Paraburkholderia piptadeniae]SIT37355.1 periplasmic trehalase [Paraburkholderia piptadeniae]
MPQPQARRMLSIAFDAARIARIILCSGALLAFDAQPADAQALPASASSGASSTAAVSNRGTQNASPVVPVPPSDLYGDLYRDVELAHLYPDSKTFADMVPNVPPKEIVADYAGQKSDAHFDLKYFVDERFTLPARETKNYVSDPNQSVTAHIDTLWSVLRRDPDSNASPWSSLLPLPRPYIVPGDRFDEIYYWDSYFIMLGLRQSGREDLLKDELDNFATLIDRYGHIPNGNRTYYLSRSQPPFFAQMVRLAAEREGDQVYLHYLPVLRREYAYWMDGQNQIAPGDAYRHLVRLPDGTLLNRYWDDRGTPRDESYREDVVTSQATPERNAEDLWRNLRAGGETGWDFSSRWFADGKSLATVEVTSLIPVDLNSLLVDLERTLAKAYRVQGDASHAENMEQRAAVRAEAIRRVAWDSQLNAFGDYDFVKHQLTHRLSAATVYPLYSGIATKAQAASVAATVRAQLLRPGGLATTTVRTGQQWDEPNGWAPLQYLAVTGLRRYGHGDLAQQIATRWIRTNVAYYQHTGKLVEKYDVDANAGTTSAGGGEYPLQDGFGWTNGVLRTLMAMYPNAVGPATRPADVPSSPSGVSEAASAAAAAPKTSHRLRATPPQRPCAVT